jgi:fructokinase
MYGAVEAGGTKFVCALGTAPDDLRAESEFPTTTPAETLAHVITFFREHSQSEPLAAIGIGAFGPLDAHGDSPTFGYITSTPKPGWANTDVAGAIGRALHVPCGIDTDVNVAALGEFTWGAAQHLANFVYLTVGTGIGGGGFMNGQLMHGLIHPEMGHTFIPHDWTSDPFKGVCPFHGDCWEGLATGPALRARWGADPKTLLPEHPAWELEAHYIALGVSNIILTVSPERIVIGGGVMQQSQLFPMIRAQVKEILNGYVQAKEIIEEHEDYIVHPQLGKRAGVLGGIALAHSIAI